jgi:hypothetical protein
MTYNPPKRAGLDDVTGEPLERRPDDNPVSLWARKYITEKVISPGSIWLAGLGFVGRMVGVSFFFQDKWDN